MYRKFFLWWEHDWNGLANALEISMPVGNVLVLKHMVPKRKGYVFFLEVAVSQRTKTTTTTKLNVNKTTKSVQLNSHKN